MDPVDFSVMYSVSSLARREKGLSQEMMKQNKLNDAAAARTIYLHAANHREFTYNMARPEISGPVVEMREVILPAGEITCTTPSEALSVDNIN